MAGLYNLANANEVNVTVRLKLTCYTELNLRKTPPDSWFLLKFLLINFYIYIDVYIFC